MRRAALGAVALLLSGCVGEDAGSSDSRVQFNPLERQSKVVEPVRDPGPPVDLEKRPDYQKILQGFRDNADALFQRSDIHQKIDQIERVFMGTGKYLELVEIYQDVVEKEGLDSSAAPRLAWAYIRLGQRKQARAFLDRLEENRREDAIVAFLDGAFWFNEAQESEEAIGKAVDAWERALELDPDFRGFSGLTADSVRRKVKQLQQASPAARRPSSGSESEDDAEARSARSPDPSEAEPGESRGRGESDHRPSTGDKPPENEASDADTPDKPPVPLLLTRADMAYSQGETGKAKRLYAQVLNRDADNVGAEFGMIRVLWKQNPHDQDLSKRARKLAERDDLDPRDAYELGLFARAKLDLPDLTNELWERIRLQDPELAKKLGIAED